MTYKEAYDKIIEAYLKDEIKPLDANFCFCGTLCDKTNRWYIPFSYTTHLDSHGYTGVELFRMERALLMNYNNHRPSEENLFTSMSAALDVLKAIHKERGEIIDEVPEFTKRELA